jgi:hypothetical protein
MSSPTLQHFDDLTEAVQADGMIASALITGRGELARLTKPGPLTAEEAERLYHLIGVLIDTNYQLRTQARLVAVKAQEVQDQLKTIISHLQAASRETAIASTWAGQLNDLASFDTNQQQQQ